MARLRVLLLVLVVGLGGCGGGGGGDAGPKFTNPVYDRNFPDPYVLEADGTYYAYATNDAGKEVQTLTSTDLVTWKPGKDALPELGKWAYPGKTWAPEVLALDDDSYVLYYTANAGGQCIGRAVSKTPAGPFVDRWPQPLVCQRAEGGSIDASAFRDDDGSLYLLWKNDGNAIGKPTYIYSQRLSSDGTKLVGRATRLVKNDEGWEGAVVEAPTLWKEEGRYYLFFSANQFDSDFYAVGYATCDGPAGPCRDAPENPILKTACRASGPGHQTLLRDDDGETWIVYHAWPPGGMLEKRVMWVDRVEWKDGKPDVVGPTCAEQEGP